MIVLSKSFERFFADDFCYECFEIVVNFLASPISSISFVYFFEIVIFLNFMYRDVNSTT